MRQGKEVTGPKTPKTPGGRKRNASTAPSTGRSTLNKKAKSASAKKIIEDLNANLDDTDSDNDLPPLDQTPTKLRYNEQELRAYQLAEGYAQPDPPVQESAQAAASPDEDDDVKIVTPGDAGPNFSFGPSSSVPASAAGGGVGGRLAGWDMHFPLGAPHYADEAQKAPEFDEDDLNGEC